MWVSEACDGFRESLGMHIIFWLTFLVRASVGTLSQILPLAYGLRIWKTNCIGVGGDLDVLMIQHDIKRFLIFRNARLLKSQWKLEYYEINPSFQLSPFSYVYVWILSIMKLNFSFNSLPLIMYMYEWILWNLQIWSMNTFLLVITFIVLVMLLINWVT